MTFLEFLSRFPTEKAAIDYFFAVRYENILACNHCGATVKVYKDRKRAKVCHCRNCNNSFSPFSGTIFEKSSTDMRKWFYAIHLVLNSKKRISARRLQRELGVLYKTAWRILNLIRKAMGNEETAKAFECFVEIDGRDADKKIKEKEATDAIQTVIAQYGYAPEYSGVRKQVGAVTSILR